MLSVITVFALTTICLFKFGASQRKTSSIANESTNTFTMPSIVKSARTLDMNNTHPQNTMSNKNSNLCMFVPATLHNMEHIHELNAILETWANDTSVEIVLTTDEYIQLRAISKNITLLEQNKLFGIKYFTQNTLVLESKFIFIDGFMSNDHLADKLYLLNLHIQSNLNGKYSHCDWFMKTDTDSYIRMDAIKLWLARDSCVTNTNPNFPLYIGHSVFGKQVNSLKIFAMPGCFHLWNRQFFQLYYLPFTQDCLMLGKNFNDIINDTSFFNFPQRYPHIKFDEVRNYTKSKHIALKYHNAYQRTTSADQNHANCFALHGVKSHITLFESIVHQTKGGRDVRVNVDRISKDVTYSTHVFLLKGPVV